MSQPTNGKTSTGLQQNIAGLLCYVLGWITGIILLPIEKDKQFVRSMRSSPSQCLGRSPWLI